MEDSNNVIKESAPVVGAPGFIPLLQCAKCGGEHPVHDSKPSGITYVRCSGATFIVGVDMKGVIDERSALAGSKWTIGSLKGFEGEV